MWVFCILFYEIRKYLFIAYIPKKPRWKRTWWTAEQGYGDLVFSLTLHLIP